MTNHLVQKEVGGEARPLQRQGFIVAYAQGAHDDQHFTVRVFFDRACVDENYFFETRQWDQRGRVIESAYEPSGYRGKTAVAEAIQNTRLACETDMAATQVVDRLRRDVLRQLAIYRPPITDEFLISRLW